MAIETVSLDRHPPGLTNHVLERRHRLFLWRGRPGHVENFLFDDRAVQVINAVAEGDLGQRKPDRNPVSRDVIEVVEVDPADGQVAEFLDGRNALDVRERWRLRLKRE